MTETPSSKRPRYKRATPQHPLTPLKLEALHLLRHHGPLTTSQVQVMMDWTKRQALSHLRDLYDHKLTDKMPIPGSAIGSTALLVDDLHYISAEGLKTLKSKGRVYIPALTGNFAHHLEKFNEIAWFTRPAKRYEGYYAQFSGGPIDYPEATILPDLFGTINSPHGTVCTMFEIDMGTERGTSGGKHDRWAAKVAAYGEIYADPERRVMRLMTNGSKKSRLIITVPTQERGAWILSRFAGSPALPYTWVVLHDTLSAKHDFDVYSPDIWLKGGTMTTSFLNKGEYTREY